MKRMIGMALTAGVACVGLVGCASEGGGGHGGTVSTLTAAPVGAVTLSTGTFSGRNDHVVTGRASVVEAAGKHYVVLDPAFTLDGAPDPKIGFGNSGAYDASTTFTVLANSTGAQAYEVPSAINPTTYNEVYIWCDEFSVALGVAPLAR